MFRQKPHTKHQIQLRQCNTMHIHQKMFDPNSQKPNNSLQHILQILNKNEEEHEERVTINYTNIDKPESKYIPYYLPEKDCVIRMVLFSPDSIVIP